MDRSSSDGRGRDRGSDGFGATRRAVLAASGAVALTGLAGCTALDGLLDRAGEQVLGTTASAPAAFYAGRPSSGASASLAGAQTGIGGMQFLSTASLTDGHAESDAPQIFRTGSGDVRRVPATARAEGREIDLEGWSTSGAVKARMDKGLRFAIREGGRTVGAGNLSGGTDDTTLRSISTAEVELLNHVTTAQDAVERREQAEAERALDGFIDTTEEALRPELDKCVTGVCETIRKNSEIRVAGVRAAREAVTDKNWTVAVKELAGVEEIVLGDIERLDDVLVEGHPGRPRFIDIIRYMRGEPTIGERFTVCLPDAKLPGDRGSLAGELTPGRVLSYFAASIEEGGRHTPFHNRYRPQGIEYDDDGCVRIDGPVSLHRDIACQEILTAELDTYRTANRAIVGYSTEGGAVVSGAPVSADTDGKCVFVAADGTLREPEALDSWGEIILGEDRDMVMPGDNVGSVSQTLVCPVAVTPADCPCPLPGLFFVRRIVHDEQVIFAGGWILDEGALYEGSATLLFEEGPTEVASLTADDVDGGSIDDRIVEQFSRGRSERGSAITVFDLDDDDDGIPAALQSGAGRDGLDAVNTKATGGPPRGDVSVIKTKKIMSPLDAPILHLAGARELSDDAKLEAAGRIETGVINSGEEVDILSMGAQK